MQFSPRYDEEIWELTDYEKEVMILVIHWEITGKFHMVPVDYNGFRALFTPNPDCEMWKHLLNHVYSDISHMNIQV